MNRQIEVTMTEGGAASADRGDHDRGRCRFGWCSALRNLVITLLRQTGHRNIAAR
jgi:hypothetical protein